MERFNKLYFFEDFVEQFLARLPPKSLMRFKCVCNFLCDLIKSPSFVAKHLSNSIEASTVPVLFKRPVLKDENNKITDEREEYCLNDDGNIETLLSSLDFYNENDDDFLVSTVVEDFIVPLPAHLKLEHSSDLIIAGHCHGIICLQLFVGNVILWNPSIKEFKLVPKSLLQLPKDDYEYLNDHWLDGYTEYLGFGYDPKSKDYKVMRFVIYDKECYWFKAELYTINSNSWKEIKTKYNHMTTHVVQSSINSIYLNGICYWGVFDLNSEDGFILSFDLGNELFDEIQYPDLPEGCRVLTLAIWKNFISLLTYQENTGLAESYDMWMMVGINSDGRDPWRKQLTVFCDGYPLLFCNSLQLLLVNNNGQIILYDIGTRVSNYIPIHFKGYWMYNQAIVYAKSIVSINGGNVLDDICISAFYGSGKFQSSYRGQIDISAFQ